VAERRNIANLPWACECPDSRISEIPKSHALWHKAVMAYAIDPVLRRLRAALDEAYGERIERVVLYGSRARGDARPDSDYDVAVFLKDLDSFGQEAGRLAEIETEILYDTGAIINAMPFKAGAYQERTGLMTELRREGLDL
jgi:predicted nucleotidyltransferase